MASRNGATTTAGDLPPPSAASGSSAPGAASRPLTKVETTAVRVSVFRSRAAHLFHRPDGEPYYDGSYDTALAEAALSSDALSDAVPNQHFMDVMLPFLLVRTAEIDHQILQALHPPSPPLPPPPPGSPEVKAGRPTGNPVRQIVLLGAGLDPRAWRLPLPGPRGTEEQEEGEGEERRGGGGGGADEVVVYELDTGTVEAFKSEVLGSPARCRRVFLRVDLAAPGQAAFRLASGGHDPGRPSVFVMEGLIGYLTREAGDALLADLRRVAAPGSSLLVTAPPTAAWRDLQARAGTKLHHVTYEEAEQTQSRVAAAGWQASLVTAEALERKYGLPGNRFQLIVGRC